MQFDPSVPNLKISQCLRDALKGVVQDYINMAAFFQNQRNSSRICVVSQLCERGYAARSHTTMGIVVALVLEERDTLDNPSIAGSVLWAIGLLCFAI